MSNRFHNKYHRQNHHTTPTSGYIDSAHDPIASPDHPFLGDFHLDGILYADAVDTPSASIGELVVLSDAIIPELAVTLIGEIGSEITVSSPITFQEEVTGIIIDELDDVVIISVQTNDFLSYVGGNWVNTTELDLTVYPVRFHSTVVEPSGGVALNIPSNALEIDESWLTDFILALLPDAKTTVPIGGVVMWMGLKTDIPNYWTTCDNKVLLKADYPELYVAIGGRYGESATEFTIPDLRGMFVRGDNDGRSDAFKDPDARLEVYPGGSTTGVGTKQADELKEHNHTARTARVHGHNSNGAWNNGPYDSRFTRSTNNRGGSETRPRNIATYYIMKTDKEDVPK